MTRMGFDLSKAAFGAVSNLDTMKKIDLSKVKGNSLNFYSMEKIDELADSIKLVGLLSPISVIPDGSEFRLVSGHRRLEAYRRLAAEDPSEYGRIPAIVIRELDDLSETMALVTANSTARELTYAEKCQQEDLLRRTLLAMKDAGRDIPRNLGQYIADQIGVSRNEVSRMHSVNENLIPEAKERLNAGEMTAQQAYALSRQPEEVQRSEVRQTYDPDDAIERWKEERAAEAALRDAFVEAYKHKLALRASGQTGRNEGIAALRCAMRSSGGGSSDLAYYCNAKGVDLSTSEGSCMVTYAELYDAIAVYAIDWLASGFPEGSSANAEGAEWASGHPEEPGNYACATNILKEVDGKIDYRVMFWTGRSWKLSKRGPSIIDDDVVEAWLPLPKWKGGIAD